MDLLLEAVRRRFGYDFQHYSRESLKRRVLQVLSNCGEQKISAIIPRLLYEPTFLNQFIATLAVTVTTLFRNPQVYQILRNEVIPILKTYPFFNIWHAGCATGEEVYSIAILLEEAGLLDRAQLYATDMNFQSLQIAQRGVYSTHNLPEYTDNYRLSGGQGKFEHYYQIQEGRICMDPELKRNMLFSTHNLADDTGFMEAHLILCRNVLIYFDRTLQNKVLHLIDDSLARGGFLCLGSKETLAFSEVAKQFTAVSESMRIFRKQVSPGKQLS